MAFADIAATAVGFGTGTSYTVNLPSGIVAGSRLIAAITINENDTDPTWPAGWTPLSSANHNNTALSIAERIADGSEGASISVQNATGVSHKACWYVARLTTVHASVASVAGTSASSLDPPSVTAPWGALDNLFIAICGFERDDRTITGYPANYSDDQLEVTSDGSNNGCSMGVASRSLASASDNPGAFTLDAGSNNVSQTIVVRTAAVSLSSAITPATLTWTGQEISFDHQVHVQPVENYVAEPGYIETAFVKSYNGEVPGGHPSPLPAYSLGLPTREEILAKRKAEKDAARKRWPVWHGDAPERMRVR